MHYWKIRMVLAFLLLIPAAAQAEEEIVPEAAAPPNFVIIFVDDMGYADAGCFGAEVIQTPNLDAMAEEGMRFTSFYTQPICGPARTALMTGCYPLRVAQKNNRAEKMPVVHLDEIFISEILKEQGYATGCFGKWDMARHSQEDIFEELMPNHQGYDYFFGTPGSNDKLAHLYRNEELIEERSDLSMLTQRYTDEAIEFITQHQEEPFFVYLPHTMPHTKLAASDAFAGQSERGLYGDVIEELDFNVGRIVETLRELDLAENTYLLFTSDNGPWLVKNQNHQDGVLPGDHGGSAGPLRSGKVSTWEGGQRVPCIWWAPGRIPAGTECHSLTATLDVLPTLAHLAGGEVPTDRIIDGHNITPLLEGRFEEADEDRAFFYYMQTHLEAVRQGPWKLHLPTRIQGNFRTAGSRNRHIHRNDDQFLDAPLLYNLTEDIGETNNVADAHPEIVARLTALAEAARIDIGDYTQIGEGARIFDSLEEHPLRLRIR